MSIWDKISEGDSNRRMIIDSGINSIIQGSGGKAYSVVNTPNNGGMMVDSYGGYSAQGSPSGYDQINSLSQSQNSSSGKISTTSGSATAQGTMSTGSTISGSAGSGSGSASTAAATEPISSVNNIWQTASLEGLWWAIQSSKFLADDMPFWVTIKKNPNSPSSDKYPTYIVIRLGANTSTSSSATATTTNTDNVYDIWIGQNIKPYIIDYSLSNNAINFEASSSRIIDVIEDIEIGVMTVAGRLVVFINNNQYVYTRKTPTGLGFCKIPSGSIDIYGTNIKASINVSPMVFARMGIMHINIPDITNVATRSTGSSTWGWQSVKYDGVLDPTETVCVLPKPPSIATKYYGCDCEKYIDGSMTAGGATSPVNPEGPAYHKKGIVRFKKSTSDFYYVSMLPTTTAITIPLTAIQSANVCYSGCPYFFRLKGANDASITTITPDSKDISDSVISISENASSGAYSHIKKTATVTLYNSSGGVSNVATKSNSTAIATTLLKYQKGIDISWGWSNETSNTTTKTFTGIVTNVTTSDIAGKEIITLTCSDYMYILDNIPFVNSPFYDGMVSAYALKDIVKRAGIKDGSILIDWVNKDNYFLPTGLSYSQPAKRFSSEQKLLEAVIDIAQKDQSLVYFNGDGAFCITKLPGGLFSVTSTAAAVGNFVSDVTTTDTSKIVILNERSIDTNFDSTVNCISLMTLDRNTRDRILSTGSSTDDRLLFRKPALLDKPALGGLAEADSYRADLGVRIYSPILKTRFTSVGTLSAAIIPFSFVTLDGQSFRVMSVKRDYSAETNDFKTSYECEWKGG